VAPPAKEQSTARKIVDEVARAAELTLPIGPVGRIGIEAVKDVLDDVLVEKGKYIRPEMVDSLTSAEMAIEPNPGPPKGRKSLRAEANELKREAKHFVGKLKKGTRSHAKPRRVRHMKGGKLVGYTMSSKDYLTAVDITAGTTIRGSELFDNGLLINPHALPLLDLNLEARRWELFDCDVAIHMMPSGNTYIDGLVFGYFDPDATDSIPADADKKLQVGLLHGGHAVQFARGGSWKPSSKRARAKAISKFYVDANNTNAGSDVRLANKWRFRCFIERAPQIYTGATGTAITMKVEFYVTYTFRFWNRTIDDPSPVGSNAVLMSKFKAKATSSSTTDMYGWSGTGSATPIVLSGKWSGYCGATSVGSTIARYYQPRCPKYVVVAASITGATTLTSVTVTDTNLTAVYSSNIAASNNWSFWGIYTVDNVTTRNTTAFVGSYVSFVYGSTEQYLSAQTVSSNWDITMVPATLSTTVAANTIFIAGEFDTISLAAEFLLCGPATEQWRSKQAWLAELKDQPFLDLTEFHAKRVEAERKSREDNDLLRSQIKLLEAEKKMSEARKQPMQGLVARVDPEDSDTEILEVVQRKQHFFGSGATVTPAQSPVPERKARK